MKFKQTLTAVGVLAVLLSTAGLNAAYADSGKPKSHGNSSSHGNSAPKTATTHGNGALASELKGLNAVHASANALDHASPNSQVGRIAAYRDAALAAAEVTGALTAAEADLAALPVPARTVADIDTAIADIDATIALLDPLDPDYGATLAALQADRDAAVIEHDLTVAQTQAIVDAQAVVDAAAAEAATAQGAEDAALLIASNGRTLSAEALAYLRASLGL